MESINKVEEVKDSTAGHALHILRGIVQVRPTHLIYLSELLACSNDW